MKRPAHLRQPHQQEIQPIVTALNSGQLTQAESGAKKLLKLYPQSFALLNLYGNALGAQNKVKEAIVQFKKALDIDPSVAELHFNVGILQTQINRIDEAILAYKKAVKLKPSLTDVHYNLGTALQSQAKYEQAAASYQAAINLEPGFFEAMVNLGVVLQEQGKLAEAITIYQRALTIQQDAQIYFNMGTALKNEGKLEQAVESYNKALAMNPNYAEVHSNLGEVLRDQGRYDESVTFYKQALAIDPSLPLANYSLAVYLYDSGDLAGALDYFQRSNYADWKERSLYCLYKTEQFDEFKTALDNYRSKKDNSPFLATLSSHYADNFGTQNNYNFCKNPLEHICHTAVVELQGDENALRDELLAAINLAEVSEKKQGRLINGVQSAGNLFKRPEPIFRQIGELVAQAVERYRQQLKGEQFVFATSFPKQIEFASSWYVRMKQGGHLTSHIHEEGWVSGALYLALPKQKTDPDEGSIELSTDGDDYPRKHNNFPTKTIAPAVGDIVMFPSSVFHRTIPFSSDEERICIAFDVKPK